MAFRARFHILFFSLSCLLVLIILPSNSQHTLFQGQQLTDKDQLFSASKKFSLEFTYGDASTCYLTIFYYGEDGKEQVWVAPIVRHIYPCGILTIDQYGNLKIIYDKLRNDSSYYLYTAHAVRNVSAVLLDTGNFVLNELNFDGSVKGMLWQSFDYPPTALLPGMKLGYKYENHFYSSLTSLKGSGPTSGSFTFGIDQNGMNQLVIMLRETIFWTSGDWKDGCFNSTSMFSKKFNYFFRYISDENEVYFNYSEPAGDSSPRLRIDELGRLWHFQFGKADLVVSCLLSYPSSPLLSEGCRQESPPECRSSADRFSEKMGVMSNNGFKFDRNENLTIYDCQVKCLNNCSCIAFASENGSDCEIWSRGTSFRKATIPGGRELYVLESEIKSKWWIWLIVGAGGALVLPILCSFFCNMLYNFITEGKKRKKQKVLLFELLGDALHSIKKYKKHHKTAYELQIFSFESIASATNNFSIANKIGEGGYGAVYKGILFDGQAIAIKRLSRSSGQGILEFKNETTVIAKLQHTNLVRLLGFCIQGEEKILIYEYMSKKSLDSLLFDSTRRKLLNWNKRFDIIEGIAQGLVYLHKYSRLKVIHRDLKASNILLDDNMNPRISDFGMARIFGLRESEINTQRVVGTLGYMPPEYALRGVVSTKTDVFSFGVIVLEIVSGKKNNSQHLSARQPHLIGLAWQLWSEGRLLELIDPALGESYQANEVLRCIQVGLLCVQDQATDRPTMIDVVSMLSKDTNQLCPPKHPAYFIDGVDEAVPLNKSNNSRNSLTISVVEGR